MQKTFSRILTTTLICIGILIAFAPLLQISLPAGHHPHILIHLSHIVPYPAIGLLCLFLSAYITRGYRSTLYIAAGLLTVVGLFSVERAAAGSAYGVAVSLLVVLGLASCAVLYTGHTIPTNQSRMKRSLSILAVITAVGLLYGVLGYTLLAPEIMHEQPLSVQDAVKETVSALVLPNELIETPTRVAKLFLASLNGVGLIIAFALLNALFQPLSLGALSPSARQRERARKIIERTSDSSEDYFKLWPADKAYYFSKSGQSFIAYKASRRFLLVLGDPCGQASEFPKLIESFYEYATQSGWGVAVLNATKIMPAYEQLGFSSLAIGHEAIVPVQHFIDETLHGKHFRYVLNKSKRLHLHVEEWTHMTPAQIATLRRISNEWLHNGRHEYTFIMGYFSPAYMRESRVFVLYENDRAIAYLNLIPTFNKNVASIDQFRSRTGTPAVGMHYLFATVLQKLSQESVQSLNIGFSPLAKIDTLTAPAATKAVLRLIKRFGQRYYSFQGVEQFKNKFEPEWHERTLLNTGSAANVPAVLGEIERASAYDPFVSQLWSRISIALGCIAVIALVYIISQ